MELIDCIPYIRFADTLCFEQQRGPSRTYDCRFLYAFKGSASLRMEQEHYTMQRGSLAVFQPDTEYVILPAPSVTLAVFDFDYTQDYSDTTDYLIPCKPDAFRPENRHRTVVFTDAPALNQPLFHSSTQFLEPEISELLTEFSQKKVFFREKVSTQFKNILIDLTRQRLLGNPHNDVVRQVIQYIDRHMTGHISNTQIGMALNYNPNYLNRLMLRHTGMSLHQYVLQRRLAHAASLLQTTDRPINDIAIELGFNSLSHFSSYFKKETGTTPLVYRKNGII